MFFDRNWSVDDLPDMSGKVAIVTGGNTGIGKVTCLELVKKHATVYLAARTKERAENALKDIKKEVTDAQIEWLPLDLLSLRQVSEAAGSFVKKEKKLNYLLNNAGIMATPYSETENGYEIQFGTNHMGPFLFTQKLLPMLEATAEKEDVRIVNVSSTGHQFAPSGGILFDNINMKDYNTWRRYGQSKLANILFAKELCKRYPKIKSYAVHPGNVTTELTRSLASTYGALFDVAFYAMKMVAMIGPKDGALATLHCLSKEADGQSGAYYTTYGKLATPSSYSRDPVLADTLYNWSLEQIKGRF